MMVISCRKTSSEIPQVTIDHTSSTSDGSRSASHSLPYSRLGVWLLNCPDLAKAVKVSLDVDDDIASHVQKGNIEGTVAYRGRRNINLLGSCSSSPSSYASHANVPDDDCIKNHDQPSVPTKNNLLQSCLNHVNSLQLETDKTCQIFSSMMEQWLNIENGVLQNAHQHNSKTSIRLLDYPKSYNSVLPHWDASGYTLVFPTSGVLQVQDPHDENKWWTLQHPPTNSCYVFLGAHLEEQVKARLLELHDHDHHCDEEYTTRPTTSSSINIQDLKVFQAPVHRVQESEISRKAVTIHVKADDMCWPSLTTSSAFEPTFKTAKEILCHQLKWDSEHFALDIKDRHVPSHIHIRDHWNLIKVLVNGESDKDQLLPPTSRLPDVVHQTYWRIQVERYYAFLQLHRQFGVEAVGVKPPRVIHHVWMSHLLQPDSYRKDCEALFDGMILPHCNRNSYHMDGCDKFHRLWKRAYHVDFPTKGMLKLEMDLASNLDTAKLDFCRIEDKSDYLDCLEANIMAGLDSMVNLYDGLCVDAPEFINILSNSNPSVKDEEIMDKKRFQYAKYLLAASYASTKGLEITPSPVDDLIWHTHQSNPVKYNETMSKAGFPTYINHVPCGKLSPLPPEKKEQLLKMTNEIWQELALEGVDVGGHGIYCNVDARRPRLQSKLLNPNINTQPRLYAWWFDKREECDLRVLVFDLSSFEQECTPIKHILRVKSSLSKYEVVTSLGKSIEEIIDHRKAKRTHTTFAHTVYEKMTISALYLCDMASLFILVYVGVLKSNVMFIISWSILIVLFQPFRRMRRRFEETYLIKRRLQELVEKKSASFEEYGVMVRFIWRLEGPVDPQAEFTVSNFWFGPALVFSSIDAGTVTLTQHMSQKWQPGYRGTNQVPTTISPSSPKASFPLPQVPLTQEQDVANTDLAWKFVEWATKKQKDFATTTAVPSNNTHYIETIGVDDMVFITKRFIACKLDFEQRGVDGCVCLGFHYTKSNNLQNIQQDGLMTWTERGNITPDRLVYGEGIYVSNNFIAFKDYGSVGILLAYIKGNHQRIQSKACRMNLDMNSVDTIVGNKKKKSTPTNGDDFNDEIVLQRSSQCIPILQFDKKLLKTPQHLEIYAKEFQSGFDKFFNHPNWYDETYSLVLNSVTLVSNPPTHQGRSQSVANDRFHSFNDQVVNKTFQYNAPDSLTECSKGDLFSKVTWSRDGDMGTKICPICLGPMNDSVEIVSINIPDCNHTFHRHCIESSLQINPKCPVCRKYVKEPQGHSPTGTLTITGDSSSMCSGWDACSTGTFILTYSMKGGVQKAYHPNPGISYESAKRVAYIPDDLKGDGRLLLKRLVYAFERGLTFMVGTSRTTNQDNVITWSSIHHKTSLSGGVRRFGYPDDSYFVNCNDELDALGVPRSNC